MSHIKNKNIGYIKRKNCKNIFGFVIFLSFIIISLHFCINIFSAPCASSYASSISPTINFVYNGETFYQSDNYALSQLQSSIKKQGFKKCVSVMNFALANGFTKREAIFYAFPSLIEVIKGLEELIYIDPTDSKIEAVKNTASTIIYNETQGEMLDSEKLFDDIITSFNQEVKPKYSFEVKTKKIDPNISRDELMKINNLRSSFYTKFITSTPARKNNIQKALSSLDNIRIEPGESISFNTLTGARNEENGYKRAKIIKNGMFVDEFGGGVCQVSTTLYNAALLADLEIIESHSHSLPVSYVEPGFDAMVSMNSSDLIIKNNQQYPVIIATSSKNDICKISIYGESNPYKIVKCSEKINENPHFERVYTTDYQNYGLDSPPSDNEYKVVSYGRAGYSAKSKLEYYSDGVLVKTKELRFNTYNPVNEVILVNENFKEQKQFAQ